MLLVKIVVVVCRQRLVQLPLLALQPREVGGTAIPTAIPTTIPTCGIQGSKPRDTSFQIGRSSPISWQPHVVPRGLGNARETSFQLGVNIRVPRRGGVSATASTIPITIPATLPFKVINPPFKDPLPHSQPP